MPKLDAAKVEHWTAMARDIRRDILQTVHDAKGGHIGGSFSAVEIMVALYFEVLNVDPSNPDWPDRDRFVLSKGHASVGLYAVMAQRGYFPDEEVCQFDHCGSRMQAHPCMVVTPGVDMSTGSLGQGLSAGAGLALGAKLRKREFRTYVLIGDGEAQEGQIWEAAMMASEYELDNLTAIMDHNKVQLYGYQHPTPKPPIRNIRAKFEAFGWHVIEIDGHDYQAIVDGCAQAAAVTGKPTLIVADTVKGKGVSFMEGQYGWHAKVPSTDEFERAMAELAG
jgi:transketolase